MNLSDLDESQLGARLWHLEQERKKLDKQSAELKEQYKEGEERMQQLLIDNGKTSTGHIEGVGEFRLQRAAYLSVNKANMPQFIEHLKAEGLSGLVKETIEANTLKAYLDEQLQDLADEYAEDREKLVHACRVLGIEDPDEFAPAELAAKWLMQYGVSSFSTVKLSHTKKGK